MRRGAQETPRTAAPLSRAPVDERFDAVQDAFVDALLCATTARQVALSDEQRVIAAIHDLGSSLQHGKRLLSLVGRSDERNANRSDVALRVVINLNGDR